MRKRSKRLQSEGYLFQCFAGCRAGIDGDRDWQKQSQPLEVDKFMKAFSVAGESKLQRTDALYVIDLSSLWRTKLPNLVCNTNFYSFLARKVNVLVIEGSPFRFWKFDMLSKN